MLFNIIIIIILILIIIHCCILLKIPWQQVERSPPPSKEGWGQGAAELGSLRVVHYLDHQQDLSNENRDPGCLGDFVRDYITQLCVDYFINQYKDPY